MTPEPCSLGQVAQLHEIDGAARRKNGPDGLNWLFQEFLAATRKLDWSNPFIKGVFGQYMRGGADEQYRFGSSYDSFENGGSAHIGMPFFAYLAGIPAIPKGLQFSNGMHACDDWETHNNILLDATPCTVLCDPRIFVLYAIRASRVGFHEINEHEIDEIDVGPLLRALNDIEDIGVARPTDKPYWFRCNVRHHENTRYTASDTMFTSMTLREAIALCAHDPTWWHDGQRIICRASRSKSRPNLHPCLIPDLRSKKITIMLLDPTNSMMQEAHSPIVKLE